VPAIAEAVASPVRPAICQFFRRPWERGNLGNPHKNT
jgi:hypothetical protein